MRKRVNMNLMITILEFVLALGVLIFLHEFGHYLAARLLKIEVEEFGFGFPPRMVKLFTLGGTDFTLNWIPFGAFVRPKGEEDPNVPDGLMRANPWVRLSVFLGGPFMNIITGILLFTLFFTQIGIPDLDTVQIVEVNEGSPAAAAGIQPGDIVLSVGDEPVNSTSELSSLIHASLDTEITMTLLRGEEEYTTTLVPRSEHPENQGPTGIVMSNPVTNATFFQALPTGVAVTFEQARTLFTMPVMLARGEIQPEQARVMGPVGIYDVFSQAREADEETPAAGSGIPLNTLLLLATISVALGLTNLLPIPALDGGRILLTLPEIITGKRIPPRFENVFHMVGFAALLLLMIFITAQDIINPVVLP